jgi:hypothetical protein
MHKRMHQLDHAHIHCVMAQCGFLCKAVMRQSVAKMSCKVGRELGRETPGPGKLERLRVLLRVQTALLHTARLVLSIVCAFKIQYVSTPVLSYFLFSAACVRALAQHRGSANVFWVYTRSHVRANPPFTRSSNTEHVTSITVQQRTLSSVRLSSIRSHGRHGSHRLTYRLAHVSG